MNAKLIEDFLEAHPLLRNEWVLESTVLPAGWLNPGENSLMVGFSDERMDDFIIDDIVIWYKTQEN